MQQSIPRWLENLLIRALKEFVPVSVIKDAFEAWKLTFIEDMKKMAADTSNKVDDVLADKVAQALTVCEPDSQFLCDLVQSGKVAVLLKLRELAERTDTELDDAGVDILEEVLS